MFDLVFEKSLTPIAYYDAAVDDECNVKDNPNDGEEHKGALRFDPPVYQQRYCSILTILEDERWSKHMKKVRTV